MICRGCGHDNGPGTVGFKAVCERCGIWLHSCTQCAVYDASAGRCRSMTTDPVRDRGERNYCEEFMPNTVPPDSSHGSSGNARERFRRLFGEEP